jgi:hypothetical protein
MHPPTTVRPNRSRTFFLIVLLASFCGMPLLSAKDLKLVEHLPQRLKQAKAQSQEGWDSGVNAKMKDATSRYNKALVAMITELISTYYPKDCIPQDDISAYLKALYTAHLFRQNALNPSGEAQGTNAALDVMSEVSTELEGLVADMAQAIVADDSNFDYDAWKARWDKAAE